MLRQFVVAMAFWATLTPLEASGASERCFATTSSPGSDARTVELVGFSVAGADKRLALPEELSDVATIVCRRDNLFMSDDDYRVLTELHLPFAFSDGDRTVWLYVENLRLLMHMDSGELSKEEQAQIDSAIERSQEIMLREGW